MAKKKGPPYEDDPECQYVVIDNPWPGDKAGSDRRALFFDMLAVWLSVMLHPRVWPEELYYVNTRADVIAKYPQDVDLTPIFGMHEWRGFVTQGAERLADKRSYIFPFNYRRLGHPPEHNWSTHLPAGDPPPHWGPPPIRQPYPRPAHAEHTHKSCSSLALPIPDPPAVADKKEEDAKNGASNAEEMQEEEERPAHYAFAHQLPDDPPQPTPPPEEREQEVYGELEPPLPPRRLFVSKLDPYDEEDSMLQFLKAEPQDLVLPAVKPEPKVEEGISHGPSPALVEAIRQYEDMRRREQSDGNGVVAKQEQHVPAAPPVKREPGGEAYRASAALVAAIEAREAQLVREYSEAEVTTRDGRNGAGQASGTRVKPEPREGGIRRWSAHGGVKPEPQDPRLPPTPGTRDPRSRDPRLASSSSAKRGRTETQDSRFGNDTKKTRY